MAKVSTPRTNKGDGILTKISPEEKMDLYVRVLAQLGSPKVKIELTEEMMDSYFQNVLEDYSTYINNWFLTQQWSSLQGLDVTSDDISFYFMTKTLNFERSFSFAYSKQVGLGAGGPSEWELKKDFITVSADTQVYSIPANREINEVLWYTPPFMGATRGIDQFTSNVWSAGPMGWNFMSKPAQFMLPSFSLMLNAQDRSLKRRLLGSELTYKITPGPNGTKFLYLYPIPGSTSEIANWNGKHYEGSKVWYFYYDTTVKNIDQCLKDNPDIIKTFNDVPLKTLKWVDLNDTSKTNIRKLFLAECKKGLSLVRGKYSGELKAGDIQLNLDYRALQEQGEKEQKEVYDEITKILDKLTLRQQMEDKADIAQNLNKVLSYIPMKTAVIYK